MDERTIKTIQWKSENLSLFKKNAQICKLGSTRSNKPGDFVKFFATYANASLQSMLDWAEKTQKNIDCSDPEVTHLATFSEDSCLFFADNDATVLEIVLFNLDGLSHGRRVPSLWCFIDKNAKAVVHFVQKRQGYYAELYCLSNENSSCFHVGEYHGRKYIIAVAFQTDDQFEAAWSQANAYGGHCLRDYLPRVWGDLLSKRGGKSQTSDVSHNDNNGGDSDDWDLL